MTHEERADLVRSAITMVRALNARDLETYRAVVDQYADTPEGLYRLLNGVTSAAQLITHCFVVQMVEDLTDEELPGLTDHVLDHLAHTLAKDVSEPDLLKFVEPPSS